MASSEDTREVIPFIGGIAMPKRMYESDAQHAFVTLMGPGLSLLPTLGLIWYAYSNDSRLAAHAGLLFAAINGKKNEAGAPDVWWYPGMSAG